MEKYIKTAFESAFTCDGLTVFGHGLGIKVLISKFIQYYSSNDPSHRRLVFCINGSEMFDYVIRTLASDKSFSGGLPKVSL